MGNISSSCIARYCGIEYQSAGPQAIRNVNVPIKTIASIAVIASIALVSMRMRTNKKPRTTNDDSSSLVADRSTITSKNQGFYIFPAEVRLLIFHHVLANTWQRTKKNGSRYNRTPEFLKALRADPVLHAEAMEALVRSNTYLLGRKNEHFYRRIPLHVVNRIESLEIYLVGDCMDAGIRSRNRNRGNLWHPVPGYGKDLPALKTLRIRCQLDIGDWSDINCLPESITSFFYALKLEAIYIHLNTNKSGEAYKSYFEALEHLLVLVMNSYFYVPGKLVSVSSDGNSVWMWVCENGMWPEQSVLGLLQRIRLLSQEAYYKVCKTAENQERRLIFENWEG